MLSMLAEMLGVDRPDDRTGGSYAAERSLLSHETSSGPREAVSIKSSIISAQKHILSRVL